MTSSDFDLQILMISGGQNLESVKMGHVMYKIICFWSW